MIILDPPPPVGAATSSLLYSKEFYETVKSHLRAGGILQPWFPGGDVATTASVALALQESFPYVRAYSWVPTSSSPNYHFLASMSPIKNASAEEMAQRMGPDAVQDFLAWGPKRDAVQQFRIVLDNEVPIAQIIARDSTLPALQDDRPTNEYFFFRRVSQPDQLRKITRQMLGWDRLY